MTTPTPALASYCCPTDLHRYCPTYRQDLAPIRLRNDPDNPSCRYAYDPVAYIVLLPESDKIPCRYAYGTCAGTVLPPIRTCLRYEYCTASTRTCQDKITLHRNPTSIFPTHPPLYTLHDTPHGGGALPASGRDLVRRDHI